jgi:hypothetical protein
MLVLFELLFFFINSSIYGSIVIVPQPVIESYSYCLLLHEFDMAKKLFTSVEYSPLDNNFKTTEAVILSTLKNDIQIRISKFKEQGIPLHYFMSYEKDLTPFYLIKPTSLFFKMLNVKSLIPRKLPINTLKNQKNYSRFLETVFLFMQKENFIIELNPIFVRTPLFSDVDIINNYLYFQQSYFEIALRFKELKNDCKKRRPQLIYLQLTLKNKQKQLEASDKKLKYYSQENQALTNHLKNMKELTGVFSFLILFILTFFSYKYA